MSKDQGTADPALVIPSGNLVCRHSTICGVMEHWSEGVMEEIFFISLRNPDLWRKFESSKQFLFL